MKGYLVEDNVSREVKFASARWSETCAVQGMRTMIGVVCFMVRGREGELRHQELERFQRIRANEFDVVFRGLWDCGSLTQGSVRHLRACFATPCFRSWSPSLLVLAGKCPTQPPHLQTQFRGSGLGFETTMIYWGYIGIMEKKMETTI